MNEKKISPDFQGNLDYVLSNLEKDISIIDSLEDKLYLEISKNDIIKYLNNAYDKIKTWQDSYNKKKYEIITSEYNFVASIISQLELCLADYDNELHMEGISYSIFEIGKILSKMKGEKLK